MAKKTLSPAQKANNTRKFLAAVKREYGWMTFRTLQAAPRGSKALNAVRCMYGRSSVAAVLANNTRGCYDHLK